MTTFLLIRHAINDMVGKALAGWTPGVHLNEEGRAQAERLAERLAQSSITAIYSSPLERAIETAEPLARRLSLEVQRYEAVGELQCGEWTGRQLKELAETPAWRSIQVFPSGSRIPGGESLLEMQTRVVAGLERLRERHPKDILAVVAHADVIKAALAHYAGIHLDLFQRLVVSPCAVSVVQVGEHGPRILRLNDTGEPPTFPQEDEPKDEQMPETERPVG